MELGQAIEIATGSGPGAEPVAGRVVKAGAAGEVVVELEGAPPGALAAAAAVHVSYRAGMKTRRALARVVARPAAGRLVLALGGDTESRDPRAHPRVEHVLRLEIEPIAPADLKARRDEVLSAPRILKVEDDEEASLGLRPARVAGAEDDFEAPPGAPLALLARLDRLDHKLDLVLERLGIEAESGARRPRYNVSLSASGMRFRDIGGRFEPGDLAFVCLELPLDPTVEVRAIAEVLTVVDDTRPGAPHLSAGRDVVLEFRVIQDDSKRTIDRYCRLHGAARRSA